MARTAFGAVKPLRDAPFEEAKQHRIPCHIRTEERTEHHDEQRDTGHRRVRGVRRHGPLETTFQEARKRTGERNRHHPTNKNYEAGDANRDE